MHPNKYFPESFFFSIAINSYDDGFTNLKSPRNDVQGISEQLELSCNGFSSIMLNENEATKEGVELFLQEMIATVNSNPSNRLVFYFAGHGKALGNNDGSATGYLIPKDGKPGDPKTWISMDWLVECLNKLDVKHLLVVLDCCFAGSLEWACLKWREVNLVPTIVYKQHFQVYATDKARQVITSAAFDEEAVDHRRDSDRVYSPFAKAFIDGLAGKADVLEIGLITARALAVYVSKALRKLADSNNILHHQRPGFFDLRNHGKGEFLFFNPTRSLDLRNAKKPIKENNPFMGLEPYEEKDHNKFFGRDRAVDEIVEVIKKRVEEPDIINLLVITGVSGSGKSSLVKAGVVPALVKEGWNIAGIIRPGEKPIESLQKISFQTATNKNLLVIDQLEELVTLGANKREAADFMNELSKLLSQNREWFVIATLRSDFQHLLKKGRLEAAWRNYSFPIPWFTRQELKEIIVQPAINMAFTYEPVGLVDTIIDDVLQFPGSLPMLSVLLTVLYDKSIENKRNRVLHQEDYDQNIGGVSGALHTKLNGLLGVYNENEPILKIILLRMINIEGGTYTKRKVNKNDLVFSDEELNKRVTKQLDILVNERIIHTVDGEGERWEPVHEAVVRWEKIRTWMNEIGLRRIEIQKELENDIEIYKNNGNKISDLWHSNDRLKMLVLELGENKTKGKDSGWAINKRERSFIELSEKIRRKREQGELLKAKEADERRAWIENQLVRKLWDFSIVARDKDNLLEALHFTAEALTITKDEELAKNMLIDIEPFLPQICLTDILTEEKRIVRAKFSPNGKQILIISEGPPHVSGKGILKLIGFENIPGVSVFGPGQERALQQQIDEELRLLVEHDDLLKDEKDPRKITELENKIKENTLRLTKYADELNLELVDNAIFSPDGKLILTTSKWGEKTYFNIWDIESGTNILVFEIKQESWSQQMWIGEKERTMLRPTFNSTFFSPDGKKILATIGTDGISLGSKRGKLITTEVKFFNSITGMEVGPSLKHRSKVNSAIFSPDGKQVLTTCDNYHRSELHLGDLHPPEDLGKYLDEYTGACLWDVETGSRVGTPINPGGIVFWADFSPNGQQLLTVSENNSVQLWDRFTGKQIAPAMQHQAAVDSVEFSPDGKNILTASGGTARLWEENTGKQIAVDVNSAVFSPNGKKIIMVMSDGTARIWDKNKEKRINPIMKYQSETDETSRNFSINLVSDTPNHYSSFRATFSPNGKQILTAVVDKIAFIVDAVTGKSIGQVITHEGIINSAVFSPDGKMVLTASDDFTARLSKAESGKSVYASMHHEDKVNTAVFSANGRMVITASNDSTARIWQTSTGKQIIPSLQHESWVKSAVFSPNGKIVLTESNNSVRFWSTATGKQIFDPIQHKSGIENAIFSPDGRKVLVITRDEGVRFFETETGKPINITFRHNAYIFSAVFSRDGKKILTAGRDGNARLWETATGKPIGSPMKHQGFVFNAVFSPDEKWILTASRDGSARIWETGTGKPVGPAMKHKSFVDSAVFSPDGKQILTVSNVNTVCVWAVEGDLDMPVELFKLQAKSITGCQLSVETNELQMIQSDEWNQIKEEYYIKAKEHYKICKYPEHNLWARFFPEEAKLIRPK
jgi:WD40 repeat protein